MIRGLTFQIPNGMGYYLNNILSNIQIENFDWQIDEDDVFYENGEYFFSNGVYKGKNFAAKITSCLHYIVFVNIQAYLSYDDFVELNTYDDFLNSDCELAILITDSSYVDVYAKDKTIIEIIKTNAEKYSFTEIKYITDENDIRVKFLAM